jgi:DNA-binding NarL/FixJ family response regulator
MIKVVLAGTQSPALANLRTVLESTANIELAEQVPLAAKAATYALEHGASVLAIYLAASAQNTFDVIRRLREAAPTVRILVVSAHAERAFAARAFEAGASGYLWDSTGENELASAVAELAGGGLYVSLDVQRRPRRGLRAVDGAKRARHTSRH